MITKVLPLFLFLNLFCNTAFSFEDDVEEIILFEGDTFLLNIPNLPIKDLPLKELGEIATKNAIIALNKGTTVPLKITIEGSIFKLEGARNLNLRLLQTLYVKFSKEKGVLVSLDTKNWESFDDLIETKIKARFAIDQTNRPSLLIEGSVEFVEGKG